MATITYDSFIRFMNKKYREYLNLSKYAVLFYEWDDYSLWLFFEKNNGDVDEYYQDLEQDIMEYTEHQKEERERKHAKRKSRETTQEENGQPRHSEGDSSNS